MKLDRERSCNEIVLCGGNRVYILFEMQETREVDQ